MKAKDGLITSWPVEFDIDISIIKVIKNRRRIARIVGKEYLSIRNSNRGNQAGVADQNIGKVLGIKN